MSEKILFSSESVTEGHPDKVCDQISDAVLDAMLAQDPNARVACETCATTGVVFVMGEITADCYSDISKIARDVIKDVGYDSSDLGFDYNTCSVLTAINEQSPDIAMGVNDATDGDGKDDYDRTGAGDQGMRFGYACDETESLMPLPITLAHALTKRLTDVRKSGELEWLRPDGKAQVTVEYIDDVPERVDTIVVSCQHSENVSMDELEAEIIDKVISYAIPQEYIDDDTKIYINPTGRFVIGGPAGDSGVTGRKIIVDTYGGFCPHGGGAFSGKDPTKVDRSASYMARYICKNLVAAGVCKRAELQVAYAIGMAHPVSVYVNTFGTGVIDDDSLAKVVREVFDLRPKAIIDHLHLAAPIYRKTSNYGHFGKEGFSWEETDMIEEVKQAVEKYKF